MNKQLSIAIGAYSDKGRKALNQDCQGSCTPGQPLLNSKGICIALADGISSSAVSQQASHTAIHSFIADYYSTSEAWSVKRSVQSVLLAINSWLYSRTRRSEHRYNLDQGYVCTFSGLVLKSATAHLFHAGDAMVARVYPNGLETLTESHRLGISEGQHYLRRALGMDAQLELDYRQLELAVGDVFVLMTDGVGEFVNDQQVAALYCQYADDLNIAAARLAELALEQGSDDNLSVQFVRIESLPNKTAGELHQELTQLAFPPPLEVGSEIDGYRIIRKLYVSARSHVFMAVDKATAQQLVIKLPAVDHRQGSAQLERFFIEEWVARRIDNPHVLKAWQQVRQRNYIYSCWEYLPDQTLEQWMRDNPAPDLTAVRDIITQIARGLQAFHRLEMLHQDLRPANIMIDSRGVVKIIDFGSVRVAGLEEISSPLERVNLLGTAQYTAPEYFLGEYGSEASDQFSLAVIAYQLLSGRLPYGAEVARAQTRNAQLRLNYRSVLSADRPIPAWLDYSLRKALDANPAKRYDSLSEFVYQLSHPLPAYLSQSRPPLLERDPVVFWRGLSVLLLATVFALLYFD